MSDISVHAPTQDIVVEEVFPHTPETIWKALTTGALISRWLMPPTGFAPVEGTRFTFQTTPAGAWDGPHPLPGARSGREPAPSPTPGRAGTRPISATARL